MLSLPVLKAAFLRRAPASTDGLRLPRLEKTLDARVAPERTVEALRKLCRYPDDGCLPLTFPYVMSFGTHLKLMADPRFPLPLMGTVHIRTAITQKRPIGAGEALRLVCTIEAQRDTDKGLEFDWETRAYVGPDQVSVTVATMLYRQRKDVGIKTPPKTTHLDGVGAVNEVWDVPARTARDYAAAAGDYNPIHLSGVTARAFGFKGIVAHGMWSLTRIAGAHPDRLRRPDLIVTSEFKTPLVLPAKAIHRHWTDGAVVHYRLLDGKGARLHALGTLTSG